ncbi:MAG: glycosyltransferase family 39 protein [Bacteroidota bacterium]
MKNGISRWLRANYPALVPVLAFVLLRLIVDFNGLYGQDSHEYLRFSKALHHWMLTGEHPGAFYWPLNFPLFGALMTFIVQDPILAMQLVSMLGGALLLVFLRQLLVRSFAQHAGLVNPFLLAVAALSPYLLRASLSVMSDVLAMAFVVGAFAAFLRWREQPAMRGLLVMAFWAALAVHTRYASFVLLAIPGVAVLIQSVKQQRWGGLLLGLGLGLVLSLPHWWLRQGEAFGFLGNAYFQDWSVGHFFQSSFTGQDGTLAYAVPNILFVWSSLVHPGFLLLGAPLLLFVRKADVAHSALKFAIPIIVLYAVFLAGLPFQNNRVLMLSLPLVVVLLFPAFTRKATWMEKWVRGLRWLPLVLAVQLALVVLAFRPHVQRNQLEKTMAHTLNTEYPDKVVYTFAVDMALRSYGTQNEVREIFLHRYDTFERGALFLFNEARFAPLFPDRNPMLNWEAANAGYELQVVREFADGWTLYEIR